MTHGNDFVVTGPKSKHVEVKNKLTGVYSISNEDHESQFDRVHQSVAPKGVVAVFVKEISLQTANTVQTLEADDTSSDISEPLKQEQFSKYRSHVARCLFLSQDRADRTCSVNEVCQRMSSPHAAEPGEVQEARRVLGKEKGSRDKSSVMIR